MEKLKIGIIELVAMGDALTLFHGEDVTLEEVEAVIKEHCGRAYNVTVTATKDARMSRVILLGRTTTVDFNPLSFGTQNFSEDPYRRAQLEAISRKRLFLDLESGE